MPPLGFQWRWKNNLEIETKEMVGQFVFFPANVQKTQHVKLCNCLCF